MSGDGQFGAEFSTTRAHDGQLNRPPQQAADSRAECEASPHESEVGRIGTAFRETARHHEDHDERGKVGQTRNQIEANL